MYVVHLKAFKIVNKSFGNVVELEQHCFLSLVFACNLPLDKLRVCVPIRDININYVDTPLPRSLPPITFTNRDFKGINPINQDDPMVVSIVIINFMVSKILID